MSAGHPTTPLRCRWRETEPPPQENRFDWLIVPASTCGTGHACSIICRP